LAISRAAGERARRPRQRQHIPFTLEGREEFGGRHHFSLLNDPDVWEALRSRIALEADSEPPGSAADASADRHRVLLEVASRTLRCSTPGRAKPRTPSLGRDDGTTGRRGASAALPDSVASDHPELADNTG